MPEEIFIIVIVSILAGTFSGIVKMVLAFMRERQTAGAGHATGDTLTQSELSRMIEEAVRKATSDLSHRVEALETGDAPDQEQGRIELPPPADELFEPAAPARRRARS
ncbi:MAG: hypothetical protein R2834_07500 [Rhodothermales bacterium]